MTCVLLHTEWHIRCRHFLANLLSTQTTTSHDRLLVQLWSHQGWMLSWWQFIINCFLGAQHLTRISVFFSTLNDLSVAAISWQACCRPKRWPVMPDYWFNREVITDGGWVGGSSLWTVFLELNISHGFAVFFSILNGMSVAAISWQGCCRPKQRPLMTDCWFDCEVIPDGCWVGGNTSWTVFLLLTIPHGFAVFFSTLNVLSVAAISRQACCRPNRRPLMTDCWFNCEVITDGCYWCSTSHTDVLCSSPHAMKFPLPALTVAVFIHFSYVTFLSSLKSLVSLPYQKPVWLLWIHVSFIDVGIDLSGTIMVAKVQQPYRTYYTPIIKYSQERF